MIAALFVAEDGSYVGLDGVDPWPASRDARRYEGPYPVVAHPPCDRWCQMAPVNQARYGHRVGDDGGCFASALAAVRRWGGILEHPAISLAWAAFDLPRPPSSGGWVRGFCGGWTAHVEQRHYGHRARKATWLYAFGVQPPSLRWGKGAPPEAWISADRPRAILAAQGIDQLSKKEAKATPLEFRDLLLSNRRQCACDIGGIPMTDETRQNPSHAVAHGVVYRTGPITPSDYDEAIEDLQRAKRQDECRHLCCSVCEDTGHTAETCHHNPLLLARRAASDETIWRCYHCGFLATGHEEAEEHFGKNDLGHPTCILETQLAALRKAKFDFPLMSIDEIEYALVRSINARIAAREQLTNSHRPEGS